jgi:hypothetical protein
MSDITLVSSVVYLSLVFVGIQCYSSCANAFISKQFKLASQCEAQLYFDVDRTGVGTIWCRTAVIDICLTGVITLLGSQKCGNYHILTVP